MTESKPDKPLSRNGIQVIQRASAVLRALRDDPGGLSLGQIAERVGLARSTVQRIVAALQEERLVIALNNGGIRLGPEVSSLAAAVTFNVAEACRPCLGDLAEATGETADLSVLRGERMIFLDQVPGTHRLRTVSAVGDVFPLTSTANGKAALAQLPEDRARALALTEWSSVGGGESGWDRLKAELEEVRARGLAYDMDEHTDGISAVGGAFRDLNGEIHAISVPVPTSRFAQARSMVEVELKQALARAEKIVGGR